MMPGELRPTIVSERIPDDIIDCYQFRSERGIFRLNFSKTDVNLEVISNDPARRPRTIPVSYRGIPEDSVERLIGILGLPADTPLPQAVHRRLRQHGHDTAHDARMLELARYLTQSLPSAHGDVLVIVDDEAMNTFYGQHPHTENPAR
jgi:hypothetical protein